jgi:hypothetical protein
LPFTIQAEFHIGQSELSSKKHMRHHSSGTKDKQLIGEILNEGINDF